ncbi:hypothetical protein B0H67DRAFT_684396, partial [Lasiosphaeris hirsuta]
MAADAQQSASFYGRWHELGQARENLVKEAEAMYWTGLKLELAAAANSLHAMLSQDPPLEELTEGSSSFITLSKRLSVRMQPYVEAWCSYYPPQYMLSSFTSPEPAVDESLGPFGDTDNPDAASDACNMVLQKSLLGDGEFRGARGHQDKPIEYRLARMVLSGL